ncbi:DUF3891 family protein [Bacillaceae bacterium S4-13-56]
MIVTEKEQSFIMVEQHQHALLSGEFVKAWEADFFPMEEWRLFVEYAIFQHDRAWILLDRYPKWNEVEQNPYSFLNYPLEDRIRHYQLGIDEVEEESIYAAILCNLHYTSFFNRDSNDPAIKGFLQSEKIRRIRLSQMLSIDCDSKYVKEHLDILQFCDDLSLFICMTDLTSNVKENVPWFANGFKQSFPFTQQKIRADWIAENEIALSPSPFKGNVTIEVPYKEVSKITIEKLGLKKAWAGTDTQTLSIIIRSMN